MSPGRSEALLERDRELDAIDRLLGDARRARGRVAVIEGPAGIGKTRLVDEARERARALGIQALAARGGELEQDFCCGVVRQLLEPALTHAGERERAALLAGAAGLARPVIATPAPDVGSTDPAHATLHGLYWLCVNLAERAPLLLAIDDVHWADRPSLRFLIHLAHRLEGLPIAVALATRTGERAQQPDLLRALVLEARPPIIRPRPLSESATASLIERVLGADAGPMLRAACHEATAGNPFLLTELLEELRHASRPVAEISPDLVRGLGPERIAAALLVRIGRRGSDALALARAVAVLGESASVANVAALAELGVDRTRNLASELTQAAVLDRGEPLRFIHPIVRAAIDDDIGDDERRRMHARAARQLAGACADPEAIAVHLLATEPSADARAVETLDTAARKALGRGAPEAAVRFLRRALAEPPAEPATLTKVLHRLGDAEAEAGDPHALERLHQAFDVAPTGSQRAEVALTLAEAMLSAGRLEDAVGVLDAALATLPRSDRELRLRLEGDAARIGTLGESTHAQAAARLRHQHTHLPGNSLGERVLLANLALLRARQSAREEAAALAERALAGGLVADRGGGTRAVWHAVFTLIVSEELALAQRYCDAALADARECGSRAGTVLAASFGSIVAYRRGDVLRAEEDARTALEAATGELFKLGYAGWACAQLINALLDRGALAEAAAALERVDVGEDVPDTYVLNPLLDARGRLRIAVGETERGLADLRELRDRGRRWFGLGPTAAFESPALPVALAAGGDRAEARRLAAEQLELAHRWGSRRALGAALRAAGVVEGGSRGLEMLEESVSVLAGSVGRLEHARALVDLGTAIRRTGRRAAARAHLAEGMDLAHRCGASALVDRAYEELRVAGARPQRPALRGIEALTASERRVSTMAATGMTNKAIAQALFVTLRTVEMHLSATYRKLEIGSRRELARALTGQDRPPPQPRDGPSPRQARLLER